MTPIPMILFCPTCGEQHIDAPNPTIGWDDPPHRSHQCQACQHIWRPADVATTGVREIQTRGTADSAPVIPRVAIREAALREAAQIARRDIDELRRSGRAAQSADGRVTLAVAAGRSEQIATDIESLIAQHPDPAQQEQP